MRLASCFGWNKRHLAPETRCKHQHTVLSDAVKCADDRFAAEVVKCGKDGIPAKDVLPTFVVVVGR